MTRLDIKGGWWEEQGRWGEGVKGCRVEFYMEEVVATSTGEVKGWGSGERGGLTL